MVTETAESSHLHPQAGGKEDIGNGVFASFEPSKPATVTGIFHKVHTSYPFPNSFTVHFRVFKCTGFWKAFSFKLPTVRFAFFNIVSI